MKDNFAENLPEKFTRNVTELFGAKGERWLADLPEITAEICAIWSLEIERVFPNLSFNFVVSCVGKTGEKYVLKIGVPEGGSPILSEKRALEAFAGNGAVRILKFDEKLCAMLLECAIPGNTLSEVCGENYKKAIAVAISVMKKLPRQSSDKSEFINLETWINNLNRAVEVNFEHEKVARAQALFAELVEPFDKKVLLHGDVHFDNILSASREPFLLIDPKGVVGEIGYEIAVFLNDLADWTSHLSNQKELLEFAVESFSEAFKVSGANLRKWAYAFAVLSAWWTMEDFGETDQKLVLRAKIWNV